MKHNGSDTVKHDMFASYSKEKSSIIELTFGQCTIVDNESLPLLTKYKWRAAWSETNRSFYVLTNIYVDRNKRKQSSLSMQQCLMGRALGDHATDGLVVDHINRNTLDNRLANLQLITKRKNSSKDRNEAAGKLTGAWFDPPTGKWKTSIRCEGRRRFLGRFETAQEAHEAYIQAASSLDFQHLYKECSR